MKYYLISTNLEKGTSKIEGSFQNLTQAKKHLKDISNSLKNELNPIMRKQNKELQTNKLIYQIYKLA